jgi:hypothetical protein
MTNTENVTRAVAQVGQASVSHYFLFNRFYYMYLPRYLGNVRKYTLRVLQAIIAFSSQIFVPKKKLRYEQHHWKLVKSHLAPEASFLKTHRRENFLKKLASDGQIESRPLVFLNKSKHFPCGWASKACKIVNCNLKLVNRNSLRNYFL